MSSPEELLVLHQQQIAEAAIAFKVQQKEIQELQRVISDLQARSSVSSSSPVLPSPVVSNPSSFIRPPKPSTFDGKNIAQAQNFILELEQYFRVIKCVNEETKFNFAASCLRDNAANWWKTVRDKVTTFDEFKTEFLNIYSPIVIADTARQMIYTLRQTEDVQKFNTEFLTWIGHLDWKEDDKMFVYRQGLKKYIRNKLMNKVNTTLLEDMSSALQIEIELNNQQRFERNMIQNNGRGMNRYNNQNGGRGGGQGNNNYRGGYQNNSNYQNRNGYQGGGNRGGYSGNGGGRGNPSGGNGSGPVPMELGNVEQEVSNNEDDMIKEDSNLFVNRLSPERFQEYKAGLCFYCKEKGHIKKDCPKMKAKPNF